MKKLIVFAVIFFLVLYLVYGDSVKNIEYYDNGQKKAEGFNKDGEKHGYWTEWYENGDKKEEGEYAEGLRHGRWTQWNEEKEIVSEEIYDEGKLVIKIK